MEGVHARGVEDDGNDGGEHICAGDEEDVVELFGVDERLGDGVARWD